MAIWKSAVMPTTPTRGFCAVCGERGWVTCRDWGETGAHQNVCNDCAASAVCDDCGGPCLPDELRPIPYMASTNSLQPREPHPDGKLGEFGGARLCRECSAKRRSSHAVRVRRTVIPAIVGFIAGLILGAAVWLAIIIVGGLAMSLVASLFTWSSYGVPVPGADVPWTWLAAALIGSVLLSWNMARGQYRDNQPPDERDRWPDGWNRRQQA